MFVYHVGSVHIVLFVVAGSILSSMVLCGSFKSTGIFYVEFLEKYRSRPTVTTLLSAMQIMLVAIIGERDLLVYLH